MNVLGGLGNLISDCTKQIFNFLETDLVAPRNVELNTEENLSTSPSSSTSMHDAFSLKNLVTPPKFTKTNAGNGSNSCSDLPNTHFLDQQTEKAYELLEKLVQKKRETASPEKEVIEDFILGVKIGEPALPRTCLHKHLEGSIYVSGILKLKQKYNLFWDPNKKRARRQEVSSKPEDNVKRIPAKNLTEKDLIEAYAVQVGDIDEPIDPNELISLNQRFDSAFGATGSVLDRVPLVDQLCLIHEEAVSYNIKYQELMFGINYEIPLSNFEKFAEEFHGNMTLANIEKCQAYLEHKLLNETLTNEEKRFLQRKMSKRFPEYPELFKELLTCSYIGAFCKLMDLELKRLENKLKVSLEVDIFDVNYPYTIKLLFEVMRHYSIGKFAAWLLGIANYLQKDSSKIVGATVDGPQKNENSVKYFKDQMDLLLHVFKNYKTRFTIHALEFSKQDFESMGEKSELADVLKVAARIGHGTMTGETTDLTMNLVHLKVFKKCFEICPTVNHLTSGLRASEMPIDFLRRFDIPWTIGTDDAGLVYNGVVPATNLRKEQQKLLDILDLNYRELEWTIRQGVESSFLSGESIFEYVPKEIINNLDNNSEDQSQILGVYKLKSAYVSLWNTFRSFNSSAQKVFLILRELSSNHKCSNLKTGDKEKLESSFEECGQKNAFLQFLRELHEVQAEENKNEKASIDALKKSFLLLTQAYQENFLSKLDLSEKARKQLQLEMELEAFRINILNSQLVLEQLKISDPRRHSANEVS